MQKENTSIRESELEAYLQWDIFVWSKALSFWNKILNSKNISEGLALEIGGKAGGLSLYLAREFRFKVICSDLHEPADEVKQFHKNFIPDKNIEYTSANALSLKFESNSFDVVIFKSVLGSIGKNNDYEKQKQAINEMYRILKPGGILLFAENAKASFIHNLSRKLFRKWGNYWRYIKPHEMKDMLKIFSSSEIKTAGFLSAFVPAAIKKIIFPVDNFLEKILSENSQYVIYGYAVK